MLLDSASLYFRAFFGVPSSVTAPDGAPVNAVRGFLDMVATLVTVHPPTRLVACWDDDWRPEFRVRALPSYKAHRLVPGTEHAEDAPAELNAQVPVIADVLAALGVPRVGHAGFEADDVMGTLAERAAAAGTAVDVVTLPVKVVSKGVDLATTSQAEADQKRGREIRQREERLGKLQRTYEKQLKECHDGKRAACSNAQGTYAEIQLLMPSVPAEPEVRVLSRE